MTSLGRKYYSVCIIYDSKQSAGHSTAVHLSRPIMNATDYKLRNTTVVAVGRGNVSHGLSTDEAEGHSKATSWRTVSRYTANRKLSLKVNI